MKLQDDDAMQQLLSKYGARTLTSADDIQPDDGGRLDPAAIRLKLEEHEDMRRSLDDGARVTKAEEYKSVANVQFKNGEWRMAIVGYISAVWLLRPGNPPCPRLLVTNEDFELAAEALGTGVWASAEQQDELPGAEALRLSLHLNVAAAALKLGEWRLARAACEFVLSVECDNVKALYRLAKAREGIQDMSGAIATASRVLQLEPQNSDARRLLGALRARRREEGRMFHGVFGRALADGEGLYTAAEEARDEAIQQQRAQRAQQDELEDASSRILADAFKQAREQPDDEWRNPLSSLRGLSEEQVRESVLVAAAQSTRDNATV